MLDIFQIEQQLGSFSDNPTRYHKEFLCLTQAYAFSWGDIYNIIDTLMEDEKERYGRQQNNTLTNSMNSIPVDIPPLLRQYLRLSLRYSGIKFLRSYDFLPTDRNEQK
jgi:hypothetical protein